MATPIPRPLNEIVEAQHVRSVLADGVMDIYAGWLQFYMFTFWGEFQPATFVSFVPLSTKTGNKFDLQSYPEGGSVIASASLSSFADNPNVAAVDAARATLSDQNLPQFPAVTLPLLSVDLAVEGGVLHRYAYQVTVLTPTTGAKLLANVVQADADQAPIPF